MNRAGRIAIGILVIIVAIVYVVGVYNLGWWVEKDSTNRRTGIANDSLARQQALVDSVNDNYRTALNIDVQIAEAPQRADVLSAQRKAVVVEFCDDYGSLTERLDVSPNVEDFYQQECV